MKLLDLLVQELDEWPYTSPWSHQNKITQDVSGEIYTHNGQPYFDKDEWLSDNLYFVDRLATVAEDCRSKVVTKEMFEAAKSAQTSPASTETNWNQRYLDLAYTISRWSKDPSTKVGAVIVRPDNTIASVGFNGYPCGVNDVNLEDREYKYQRVIHAEMNAILSAKEPLNSCTLYVTLAPCSHCAAAIIQSGIKTVYFDAKLIQSKPNWAESFETSYSMCAEAGVELIGL